MLKAQGPSGTSQARIQVTALALALASILPAGARADELRPETAQVWDGYVAAMRVNMERRLSTDPFLWIDEDRERARRVRAGEIVVLPGMEKNPLEITHALIHHWLGAVFVPQATLDQALSVLNDYDRYAEYFTPDIARAHGLTDGGDEQTFAMVLVAKALGITAAIDTEMDGRVRRIDTTRAFRYFSTRRVQSIEHFGRSDEHMDGIDSGPGYVWRLVMAWRLEERDGGVYVEMETLAMSRGIPRGVRWLIEPTTSELPRKIITHVLESTREAVARGAAVRPTSIGRAP